MTSSRSLLTADVLVVGAGGAGLACAHELLRGGLEPGRGFLVLDAEEGPGGAWRHRWPTLTMGWIDGGHDLPGYPLGDLDPELRARDVMPHYLAEYEARLGLTPEHLRRPLRVVDVGRGGGRLTVRTAEGDGGPGPVVAARTVLSATGTWTRPWWPTYPGAADFRGPQVHTATWAGAAALLGGPLETVADPHVVVVGGGTSAVQHLAELAPVAGTTWVTRSEPVFRDPAEADPVDEAARRAAVELMAERVAAGEPVGSMVSATGIPLTPEVAELRGSGVLKRHPVFRRITPTGVRWADGSEQAADAIVWATGFRPALDHLRGLGLRERGGGIRLQGTRVVREPRLHLIGYGPAAGTIGATRAARAAVREVRLAR
ncbi:FAD-dependent oxidoreductase [Kineococcus gynurae]|uniref:FAD-dependent oxidoreductase n=1 Tax=Kineococcus gynurae TaxID=452979 RepID=A0ABV5LMW5_9ACTN